MLWTAPPGRFVLCQHRNTPACRGGNKERVYVARLLRAGSGSHAIEGVGRGIPRAARQTGIGRGSVGEKEVEQEDRIGELQDAVIVRVGALLARW